MLMSIEPNKPATRAAKPKVFNSDGDLCAESWEFAFTGILWGFPVLDIEKPCNNLIF